MPTTFRRAVICVNTVNRLFSTSYVFNSCMRLMGLTCNSFVSTSIHGFNQTLMNGAHMKTHIRALLEKAKQENTGKTRRQISARISWTRRERIEGGIKRLQKGEIELDGRRLRECVVHRGVWFEPSPSPSKGCAVCARSQARSIDA